MDIGLVGLWYPPKHCQEKDELQAFVLNQLQRRNCFDQDYEFNAGVQLILYYAGHKLKFRYGYNGEWAECFSSNPFTRKEEVRTVLGEGKVR